MEIDKNYIVALTNNYKLTLNILLQINFCMKHYATYMLKKNINEYHKTAHIKHWSWEEPIKHGSRIIIRGSYLYFHKIIFIFEFFGSNKNKITHIYITNKDLYEL